MSLYHYTDVNAVQSILSKQKIWLTDIRFLNDSQELHDGMSFLKETLNAPMPSLFSNHDYVDKAIEQIKKALSDTVNFGISEEPLFIFSLSQTDNALSQWRAYGNYCIEFDVNKLQESISNLHKCTYLTKEKLNTSVYSIAGAIGTISQDLGKNSGCTGPDYFEAILKLIENAATFKHIGFIEEKETRIIMSANESEYPNNIKFRSRGDILIPYLEVDLPLDCIKSIRVGPMANQELALSSMSLFLNNLQANWQVDNSDYGFIIDLEKSDIPFRE